MPATLATVSQPRDRHELAVLFGGVAIAALLFLGLAGLVWHTNGPVAFDRLGERVTEVTGGNEAAAGRIYTARTTRLALAAVGLGMPAAVAALAGLVLYLAIACRDWVGAVVVVTGPLVTGALTEYVAKPLVDRRTPGGAFMFPSGHTAGVAAVCITALIIVYRHGGGRAAALAAPLAAGPVLVVGLGVVRVGFHWSTDVAGGLALAAAVVLALTLLLVLTERTIRRRGLRAVTRGRAGAPAPAWG